MNKVVRDGKVAVLHTDDWGAGWYSWHGIEELLFDPEIVRMIENPDEDEDEESIIRYCEEKYGAESYYDGARTLTVTWIPEGSEFIIHEYDGVESIWLKDKVKWHTA